MKYVFQVGKEPAKVMIAENVIAAHELAKKLATEHNVKVRFFPALEDNAVTIEPPKEAK